MIVKENQRLYKIYSSLLAESEEVEELEDETIVDSKEVCKEDTASREDKIIDDFLSKVFGESEECEDTVDCKKIEESEEVEADEEEVEVETESEKVCEKEDGDWISAKDFFKMEESEEIDIEDSEEIDEDEEEEISIEDEVSEDIEEVEVEDEEIEEAYNGPDLSKVKGDNETKAILAHYDEINDLKTKDEAIQWFFDLLKKYNIDTPTSRKHCAQIQQKRTLEEVLFFITNIMMSGRRLGVYGSKKFYESDKVEGEEISIEDEVTEEAVDANEFFNV
jgi:hypothetical protein